MLYLLTAKLALDAGTFVALLARRDWGMAIMFAGFAVADAGCLIMAKGS